MEKIPEVLMDQFVTGVNIMPGTLRDQLGDIPTVLVFLRYFGCTFCRETVDDLRQRTERDPSYPPAIFFFQGTPREGRAFLRTYWPKARAISDPELKCYDVFGVGRGNLWQTLGPGVLASKRRANQKGHHNGERSGDIWRMPGLFVVQGDRVLWQQRFKHAAEYPDFDGIPAFIEAAGPVAI